MRTLRRIAELITAAVAAVLLQATAAAAQTVASQLLQLEAKMPLGDVRGRIDHMAIDLERQRLFVVELENNSMAVVDLRNRKVVRRISGLKEPQGVAYLRSANMLYVSNAGDGSVRLFQGSDYAEVGRIDLGDDADNIRIDAAANRLIVGYGNGALAMIDPTRNRKIAEMPLKAHPESFQLDRKTQQLFVNVPSARAIVVIDRLTRQQRASWSLQNADGNFPMVLDEDNRQVLVAFRSPARLGVFSMQDGAVVRSVETCGDADWSSPRKVVRPELCLLT
jgi:DNA-binding beta-propeller fold protein YncE